jgi:hypothetical protein
VIHPTLKRVVAAAAVEDPFVRRAARFDDVVPLAPDDGFEFGIGVQVAPCVLPGHGGICAGAVGPGRSRQIDDDARAARFRRIGYGVVVVPAVQRIVATPAQQEIVFSIAEELVVVDTAAERVFAASAIERILGRAGMAAEIVVSVVAGKDGQGAEIRRFRFAIRLGESDHGIAGRCAGCSHSDHRRRRGFRGRLGCCCDDAFVGRAMLLAGDSTVRLACGKVGDRPLTVTIVPELGQVGHCSSEGIRLGRLEPGLGRGLAGSRQPRWRRRLGETTFDWRPNFSGCFKDMAVQKVLVHRVGSPLSVAPTIPFRPEMQPC